MLTNSASLRGTSRDACVISEADQTGGITLGCDEHWNVATNRRVGDFILTHYRKYLTEDKVDQ